ncbi:hypothetical protein VNI00_018635 [Paramarasmius palmivorus]|uniref:Uncharacterized protein n=1 Tax=Paramarasmius palmivorus TaxID=297713 RepID=A0AAW0AVL5_9AGAR
MPKQTKLKAKLPVPSIDTRMSPGSDLTSICSSKEGSPNAKADDVSINQGVEQPLKAPSAKPFDTKKALTSDPTTEKPKPVNKGSKPKQVKQTQAARRSSKRILYPISNKNRANEEQDIKPSKEELFKLDQRFLEEQYAPQYSATTPETLPTATSTPSTSRRVIPTRTNSPEWDDGQISKDLDVNLKRSCDDDDLSDHDQSSISKPIRRAAKKPKFIVEEAKEDEDAEGSSIEDVHMEERSEDGAECESVEEHEDQGEDQPADAGEDESDQEEASTSSEDPFANMHPITRQIFHTKYQHRSLRNFYLDLAQRPWIASMRPGNIVPYAKKLSEEPESGLVLPARYQRVMSFLSTIEQTAVMRMMTFERHGQYMNLARASPFNVRTNRNMPSAVFANDPAANLPAVFVTLAISQGSELLYGSGSDDEQKSRKLYIQLLEQEFQYMSAFVCTLMQDGTVHCPIYRSALLLQSKRQNFPKATSTDISGLSKEGLNTFSNASNKKGKKKATDNDRPPSAPHPPFRLFDDKVPVYDGRPKPAKGFEGFRPSVKGWKNLASMERYSKEIPNGSIVIPGFTISGPWRLKPNLPHPTAHFNLIFAIVLSDPLQNSSSGGSGGPSVEID